MGARSENKPLKKMVYIMSKAADLAPPMPLPSRTCFVNNCRLPLTLA